MRMISTMNNLYFLFSGSAKLNLCIYVFSFFLLGNASAQLPVSDLVLDSVEFRNVVDSAQSLLKMGRYSDCSKLVGPVYMYCSQNPEKYTCCYSKSALLFARASFNLKEYFLTQEVLNEWVLNSSTGLRSVDLINVHIILMYCYDFLGNKLMAKEEMEKALSLSKNERFLDLSLYQKDDLKDCIHNLLKFGRDIRDVYGRYEDALSVYEKAIFLQMKSAAASPERYTYLLTDVGYTYFLLRKYEKAIDYYKQGLDYVQSLDTSYLNVEAYVCSLLGQYHLRVREFNQAFTFFERGIQILKDLGKSESLNFAFHCKNMGFYYDSIGNAEKALGYYDEALKLIQKYEGVHSTSAASYCLYIGRSHLKLQDFQKAAYFFNEDIRILEGKYGPNYYKLFYSLEGAGEAYYNWFLKTGEDNLKKISLDYFDKGFRIIRNFVMESQDVQLKKLVLSKAYGFCSKYLNALNSGSFKYQTLYEPVSECWDVVEFMHNSLMLVNLLDANARSINSVPDSLILLQEKLQLRINELEFYAHESQYNRKSKNIDTSILGKKAYISFLKDSLEAFRAVNSIKYPETQQNSILANASTLGEVQKTLNPRQTVLEYLCSDSMIFLFMIQKDHVEFRTLSSSSSLRDLTSQYVEGLCGYQLKPVGGSAGFEKGLKAYIHSGNALYNILIAPVEDKLTEELIIIPDAMLSKISFEALLREIPKNSLNFKEFAYLIKKFSVSYQFSATTLTEFDKPKVQDRSIKGLLAFAPFYNKNQIALQKQIQSPDALRYGLSELPYSGEEIRKIENVYPAHSRIFFGNEANKLNFLKLAPEYMVIHLATHGRANYEEGNLSFLAFRGTGDSGGFDILTGLDFQTLRLNAELVVLSACETGDGETNPGNGVVSLASTVASSGVHSILSTLWKVNDKATMHIMEHFYKGLKKGMTKNKALQVSKLEYINNIEAYAKHPFYWAGFMLYGNTRPLSN